MSPTRPSRRRIAWTLAPHALALAIGVALAALLLAGLLAASSALAAGGWSWPVDGEVVTAYRNGDDPYAAGQHRGVDIAADEGATVRAATAGTVTFAGTVGSAGLIVSIRTADGRYDTSYLHLGSLAVAAGDAVEPGSALGSVGTSGERSVETPHVHFGVRDAGERHAYHDPLPFLGAPGAAPGPPVAPPLAPPRRPAPAPAPAPPPPVPAGPPPRHRAGHPAGALGPKGAPLPEPGAEPGTRPGPVPGGAPRTVPELRPARRAGRAGTGAPAALGPAPAPARGDGAGAGGDRRPGWALAGVGVVTAIAALAAPRVRRRGAGRHAAGVGDRARGSDAKPPAAVPAGRSPVSARP